MKKKITLREIASKAKVSPATASIVLNDKKNQGISEKMTDQYIFPLTAMAAETKFDRCDFKTRCPPL